MGLPQHLPPNWDLWVWSVISSVERGTKKNNSFCFQSPKKVGEDIQKATMEWKGIKVTVRLSVINRVATPTIVPTASSMILKELKEPPRDRKKVKNVKHGGNITLDAVIGMARILRSKSMAKKLRGTVKEVLGTAFSVGCTVNGKSPKEVQKEIDDGVVTIPDE